MRECPFKDCQNDIPDSLFACRKHWFRLTQKQRQTINDAYAAYLKDRLNIETLRRIQQDVLDNVPGGPHHA